MRVYIAAKYHRRHELRDFDRMLREAGHITTSRWVFGEEEKMGPLGAAQMDVDDVRRADALVFFAEPRGSENRGGGRYFELGLAYAEKKRLVVVLENGHETVFTHLPQMGIVYSKEEALGLLGVVGEGK